MALSHTASGAGEGSDNAGAETRTFADIGGLLDFYARKTPAAPALLAPGRPALTYGKLGDLIQQLVRPCGDSALPLPTGLLLRCRAAPTARSR